MNSEKSQKITARDIDHGTTADDYEAPDTNADPEGSEDRAEVRSNQLPYWVTDEFEWRMKNNASDPSLDKSWYMAAKESVIKEVAEAAPKVYARNQYLIDTDEEIGALHEEIYRITLDLYRTIVAFNAYALTDRAMSDVNVAAKGVASATRFGQRGKEFQARNVAQGKPDEEGPRNMLAAARNQAAIATVMGSATVRAYNQVTKSMQGSMQLGMNKKAFEFGARAALNIEASGHAKKYDHPGKGKQRNSVAASAALADFDDFFGED